MFGWLKQWGPAARNARAEREIEAAIERTAAMAQAIEARRAREQAAQDEAARIRAAATARWEALYARKNERAAFERGVVRKLQQERDGKIAQARHDRESASASMPWDMGTPAYLVPIHHAPASSDGCAASGSESASATSSDGGSCGGGDGSGN